MFAIERYDAPASLAEAVALLREYPSARPLAGGTDILVGLRESMESAHLVDIGALPELKVEERTSGGVIRLGAGLTFSRLVASPLVREHLPMLSEAADTVAGPQIRNMGTVGGNLCNGAVSADTAAPLLALNASLHLVGPDGERTIPLADFHVGPGKVALHPAELLTHVEITPDAYLAANGSFVGMAWRKYAMRAAMDIATVGCAACVRLAEGRIQRLNLAFSVAAPTPVRCPAAEATAAGTPLADLPATLAAVARAVEADVAPRSSWRADKDFRLHIIRELSAGVIKTAVERAGFSGEGTPF